MKKTRIWLLTALLLFAVLPAKVSLADDITGISLEQELREAINKEIMYGYSEGIYKPGNKVTRGEFANFISRALKLQEGPHKFPDVSITSSLAPGINASAEAGIVSGQTGGYFNADEEISREQMVIMIKNAMDYKLVDVPYEAPTILTDFHKVTSSTSRIAIANSVSLNITIGFPNADGKTYRFEPAKDATRAEAAAFIIRMIHAIEGIQDPTPEPEEKPFKIAEVDSNGELNFTSKEFKTYTDAVNSWNAASSSQVVTLDGKVIKMQSGLVYSNPSIGMYTTKLYSDPELKSEVTYVQPNEEMKYIASSEDSVKVYLGGLTAYAKQSEVSLMPAVAVKKQNFYSVNSSNELVFNFYSPALKTYYAFEVGKAPSFLKQGVSYYSWDGYKFYSNANGGSSSYVGKSYTYYQYLSGRAKTVYTADQLNQYINQRLLELENLYKASPSTYAIYKDATTKSKVIGLGTYLKEMESKYNVNALLILAMAFHEGQYGMSSKAQTLNNLFGIKAYDSNPDKAEPYPTVNASVDALINSYLDKNYIPPTGPYANGAVPGNKAIGYNVKYASDAYWGAKVASHMYRIDRGLGLKDYKRYTTIGLINTDGTNVRSSASSAQGTTNLLYTFKTKDKPVIIVSEEKASDGWIWYKIVSDDRKSEFGYVRSDLIDKVDIN
ncbi:S-layer homology domain-containing protein [Cytobacillus spongiae]|uniref:S-layer homology domain-containing protein n=1 Tax=Cytobacillus spongiae TaxID=2901381 RepID=UPI001F250099|nr:S-layer homology domain-containing protein [Cytobacillus spongiae]UII55691.1 S-layer homology domain-containing protein [Cytobacillus spongiae]